MTKEMKEIFDCFKAKSDEAKSFQAQGETVKASAAINEAKELLAKYNNLKDLYELEKNGIPDDGKSADPEAKVTGFGAMAKIINGFKLSPEEKALMHEADPAVYNATSLIRGGASGENYLIPQDVDTTIREYRKTYVQLRELVTTISTSMLAGSEVFAKDDNGTLASITDGTALTTATAPSFEQKSWSIDFVGNVFPVSNIVLGAEKSGLMSYLNRFFIRRAVNTENNAILALLKADKTATACAGLLALRKAKNTKLDPAFINENTVVITNQTGFDRMDSETDANGRPLLSVDLANPTQKRFDGHRIVVLPDSVLPEVSAKSPVFIGDMSAAIYFIAYQNLMFSYSEHVYFASNQTAIRMIEGFDTIKADPNAYIYCTLAAASA